MALKTKPGSETVAAFIEKIADEAKRKDCNTLLAMMQKATGETPELWAGGMVGFGRYLYKYESGTKGEWFITGFAPRKQNLSIYIMPGLAYYGTLLEKLGKYKNGVSCLYVNSLKEVDGKVLEKLIRQSVQFMKEKYKPEK
jgi:hypothetical protein